MTLNDGEIETGGNGVKQIPRCPGDQRAHLYSVPMREANLCPGTGGSAYVQHDAGERSLNPPRRVFWLSRAPAGLTG